MTASPEDGWIEWAGGECPVDTDTRVAVRFRDAPESIIQNETAGFWQWERADVRGPLADAGDDIIAYRVISA